MIDRSIELSEALTDNHNKICSEAVSVIVRTPIEIGGNSSDVLLLLESVTYGVIATLLNMVTSWQDKTSAARYGSTITDIVVEGVKARLFTEFEPLCLKKSNQDTSNQTGE